MNFSLYGYYCYLFKEAKTGLENFLSGSVRNPHPGGHPSFSF